MPFHSELILILHFVNLNNVLLHFLVSIRDCRNVHVRMYPLNYYKDRTLTGLMLLIAISCRTQVIFEVNRYIFSGIQID